MLMRKKPKVFIYIWIVRAKLLVFRKFLNTTLFKHEQGITTYFKTPSEINISKAQVEMFAYVFDPDLSPRFTSLLKKDNGHWYLMVMCLKLKTTFHLDSNLPAERKESRTTCIENLAVVLSDIITSSHFADCPFEHADFSGGWSSRTIDVVDNVQPLPKCKDNFAIWVLSWLHMEYLFNFEIPSMISEHGACDNYHRLGFGSFQ
ncbi:hypothetical protein PIB30_087862 [Stylosanthes scabra]|uniref:Ubiquitin-like protease family profile domain-containing protein n=1 Tax=Stylosanthes scabra TaxID=79078 RepID=A0ABU6RTR3_9FABA|nr:hypothetical protein [Stylosanthes scabra]